MDRRPDPLVGKSRLTPRAGPQSGPRASRATWGHRAARGGLRLATTLIHHAGWALGKVRGLAHRTSLAFARWSMRNRSPIARVGERLLWWGALAMVANAGLNLMSGNASEAAYARVPTLALGAFAMCAAICVSTPASHLRKGALMLGSASAALGLVAWMSSAA